MTAGGPCHLSGRFLGYGRSNAGLGAMHGPMASSAYGG